MYIEFWYKPLFLLIETLVIIHKHSCLIHFRPNHQKYGIYSLFEAFNLNYVVFSLNTCSEQY